MSRLCDAAAVALRSAVLSGSSPMGLKLCRNFKYPSYFLPVPKMGTTSRRDGVIAKCEKSRRGDKERESVNIFAAKIRFAPALFGDVGWEKTTRS